jgi:hypothetical protein
MAGNPTLPKNRERSGTHSRTSEKAGHPPMVASSAGHDLNSSCANRREAMIAAMIPKTRFLGSSISGDLQFRFIFASIIRPRFKLS